MHFEESNATEDNELLGCSSPKKPKLHFSADSQAVQLPIRLPKSFMKRSSEFHSKLGHKKNPVMRSAVSVHQLFRVMKSPSTKHVAAKVFRAHSKLQLAIAGCSSHSERKFEQLKSKLNKDLRKVIRWRTQKKYNNVMGMKMKWKEQKISLRKVSRVTGTPMSSLRWYFTRPKGNPRKISPIQIQHVLQFFSRHDVTMQLPHKRYASKRFLRTTFHEQYKRYVQHEELHGRQHVSKTSVHRILPKKVFKTCGKIPMQNCKCGTCENCSLLLAAAIATGMKGVSKKLSVNALMTCCEAKDAEAFSRPVYSCGKNCRRRNCKYCKDKYSKYLTMANRDIDMDVMTQWHKWGHEYTLHAATGRRVKGPYQSNVTVGTRAELLGELKLNIPNLPRHLFDYYWQSEQLEECKRKLQPGELLVIVDFAKNITFPRQHEVQHGFFHRRSATLHPVIMYYKCKNHEDCEHLVHDEFMVISDDLCHDAHAVHTYTKLALEHLRKQGTPVEKLYIFSDNCANQYKSKLPFELLQFFGIPAEHHYFGAGHGKSAADGFVGRLKKMIEDAIRSGKAHIQDALDLALWCKKAAISKLKITPEETDCIHYQREFEYVKEVDRTYIGNAMTIKGTMKIHSVKTTGVQGRLLCRANSCFCRSKKRIITLL